jgi:hypothetical protein
MNMLFVLCLLGNVRNRRDSSVSLHLIRSIPSKPLARAGQLVSESNAGTDGEHHVRS